MSGHVLPIHAATDSADRSVVDSKHASDGAKPLSVPVSASDFPNIRLAQDRHSVRLASWSAFDFMPRPVVVSSQALSAALSGHVRHVVSVSTEPQMRRVYTRRSIAVMKNVGPVGRNRANRKHPGQSMRQIVLSADVMATVPVFKACRPYPARPAFRAALRDRAVPIDLLPEVIRCILPHSSVEPPSPRFRGQGRSGASNTLAVRSFYHFSAENLNKTTRKAA